MTDKIIVRFDGDGSGIAELSWGQKEIWSVMAATGDSLPMGGVRALPPGQTSADVVARLRFIMARHQSLRTRLRFGPGGQIEQVVHASGEIGLEAADAGDGDPGAVAAAVAAGYKARKFDLEREWPIRMAVVTQRGAATHIAVMICHIAVDAFGLAALYDDFDRFGEQSGPPAALPPLEQARKQSGPSGRRAHEASMRYFKRLAASVPDRQFTESGDPRAPRFWQVTCETPAGYQAARMLAARFGLSTSPVLLAAFAAALGSLTATDRVALHLVVNNRFRPGLARSVSPVMQSCLCVLEVAGVSFEALAGQAWQSSLGAYKNAYFDPVGKHEVCEQLAAERGAEPDWSVIFNDRRVSSREIADTLTGAGELPGGAPSLRDEMTQTILTWGERNDMPAQKVFLNICDAPGTLCCELWADTHFVSPADMAALLRRIESVLVDAALGQEEEEGEGVGNGRQRPQGTGHEEHERRLAQDARS